MRANHSALSFESPYDGYAYSYPHKSAYRQLDPPVPLETLWNQEDKDSLFLYLHVPFCEYRCGFCNLFTMAGAESTLPRTYLKQLRVEAETVRRAIGEARFELAAIGGGTPTYLDESELAELLEIADIFLGDSHTTRSISCEASPATWSRAKAALLFDWGVTRVSLGVQSFNEAEAKALGRPQSTADVFAAIESVRDLAFPTLNLDLIYGLQGQSLTAWMKTVETAAALRAEEIYLYPLYVRALTGLGKVGAEASDRRLEHYREARNFLVGAGYEQKSLRMFALERGTNEVDGRYRCQADGMIGLGCGARSYTARLHYSTEFAVGRSGVRSILGDYLKRDSHQFSVASHGVVLDREEERRRYVIQSLLQREGLHLADYQTRFHSNVLDDLPQLGDLLDGGWASALAGEIRLTSRGLDYSDAIGPWLYSEKMKQRMEQFECA